MEVPEITAENCIRANDGVGATGPWKDSEIAVADVMARHLRESDPGAPLEGMFAAVFATAWRMGAIAALTEHGCLRLIIADGEDRIGAANAGSKNRVGPEEP